MPCSTSLGTALITKSLIPSWLADWSCYSYSKVFHIEIQVLLHKRLNVSGQCINKLPSFLWNLYHNCMICRGNHACHYKEVIVSCSSQSALYWCCNILAANVCKKASMKNLVKCGRKSREIWIKEETFQENLFVDSFMNSTNVLSQLNNAAFFQLQPGKEPEILLNQLLWAACTVVIKDTWILSIYYWLFDLWATCSARKRSERECLTQLCRTSHS